MSHRAISQLRAGNLLKGQLIGKSHPVVPQMQTSTLSTAQISSSPSSSGIAEPSFMSSPSAPSSSAPIFSNSNNSTAPSVMQQHPPQATPGMIVYQPFFIPFNEITDYSNQDGATFFNSQYPAYGNPYMFYNPYPYHRRSYRAANSPYSGYVPLRSYPTHTSPAWYPSPAFNSPYLQGSSGLASRMDAQQLQAQSTGESAEGQLMTDDESELGSQDGSEGPLAEMGFFELHRMIQEHFKQFTNCRLSWLNRLFCKASTPAQWQMCVETSRLYLHHLIFLTPETGTLLIKSACRLGVPEQALDIMNSLELRIWPTLSGVHYLMINFSQKHNTDKVFAAYQITKLRNLKPNSKTFHILIREYTDNGAFDKALAFADECRSMQIVPNRVTYNILMNGHRKQRNADAILSLRKEMDSHNIELNDTTAKFTALAYMMRGESQQALDALLQAPSLKEGAVDSLYAKLIETGKEDQYFRDLVVSLLQQVHQKVPRIDHLRSQLEELKTFEFPKAATNEAKE